MTVDGTNAGIYEVSALFWDEITSKPSEPFEFKRHKRGDKVRLNEEDARRLFRAGAVVVPGEAEKAAAAAALQQLQAAMGALSPEDRERFAKALGSDAYEPEQSEAPKGKAPKSETTTRVPAEPRRGPSRAPKEVDPATQPPQGGQTPVAAVTPLETTTTKVDAPTAGGPAAGEPPATTGAAGTPGTTRL